MVINFNIDDEMNISSDTKNLTVKQGENLSTTCNINIPESMKDCYTYVDIKLDSMTDPNKIQKLIAHPGDSTGSFDITADMIIGNKILFEIVFKKFISTDETYVAKTRDVTVLVIEDGINVTEDITGKSPDVIVQMQNQIDSMQEELDDHIANTTTAHGLDQYSIKQLIQGNNIKLEKISDGVYKISSTGGGEGGSGGTMNHPDLLLRNEPQQHTTDAIYDPDSGLTQTEINSNAIQVDPNTGKIEPQIIPVDNSTITFDSSGNLYSSGTNISFNSIKNVHGNVRANFTDTQGQGVLTLVEPTKWDTNPTYMNINLKIGVIDLSVTPSNIGFIDYNEEDTILDSSLSPKNTPFSITTGSTSITSFNFDIMLSFDMLSNLQIAFTLPSNNCEVSINFNIFYN